MRLGIQNEHPSIKYNDMHTHKGALGRSSDCLTCNLAGAWDSKNKKNQPILLINYPII